MFSLVYTMFGLFTIDYFYIRRRLRLEYARIIRERGLPPHIDSTRSSLFQPSKPGDKPSIYVRIVDWFDRYNGTFMAVVTVLCKPFLFTLHTVFYSNYPLSLISHFCLVVGLYLPDCTSRYAM